MSLKFIMDSSTTILSSSCCMASLETSHIYTHLTIGICSTTSTSITNKITRFILPVNSKVFKHSPLMFPFPTCSIHKCFYLGSK